MRNLILSLGCLILSSTCLAQQPTWTQVKTASSPSARWQQGNAYDIIRGRTIVFGGHSAGASNMNDTWEYDGTNWTKMNPKNSPPGRGTASMVYHSARVRTVMFGGRRSAAFLNDTWTWDGKDWTKMNPKNSPAPRWMASMAYDSARQSTVLFGGNVGANYSNDTWEWDGVNWTQMTPATKPPTRNAASMAYDIARGRVVLFGGWNGSPLNDTWEWDGKNWTQLTSTTSPSARFQHSMAYDAARKRMVMFGGANTRVLSDTWEWDAKTWTKMKPTNPPSARRLYGNMVYDSRRGRMVLFGGDGNGGQLADTWEYVGLQTLTGSPPTISIASGGTHSFTLTAGTPNASRLYWVFGSVTGTSPGVTLASPVGSVNIPLNPDFWTDITIGLANSAILTKTKGALDNLGKATASFNVPKITNSSAIGVKFYHAYLVYDAKNNFYMASNPVELMLVR